MSDLSLLLDLEGTVIESWGRRRWLQKHLDAIRDFADQHCRDRTISCGLMSWAVMDDSDIQEFNRHLRRSLEESLDMQFRDEMVRSMEGWSHLASTYGQGGIGGQELLYLFDKPSLLFGLRHVPGIHPWEGNHPD
jgi:CRP-like cAMP-binding protein